MRPPKKKVKKAKELPKGLAACTDRLRRPDERQIQFRNYIPRTWGPAIRVGNHRARPELRDFCLTRRPGLVRKLSHAPRITSADIEADIDKEIKAAIAAAEDTDAVLAIAPRKPNWVGFLGFQAVHL